MLLTSLVRGRSCAVHAAHVLRCGGSILLLVLELQGCAAKHERDGRLIDQAPIATADAGYLPAPDGGVAEVPDEPDDRDGGDPAPVGGALGEPIAAQDRVWTWVDFPDAFCRDGSTTGIAVSLNNASSDLVIYLEGGGACFDAVTCVANSGNALLLKGEKKKGIFDRGAPDNPLKTWSVVYVPYCTGDVHAGTNPSSVVPGFPGIQKFVGHLNIQAFLKRIVPTFPGISRVLLTGASAGAFGASVNTIVVQRAFPKVDVMLINDSGPPLSSEYLSPCLQQKWRDLWGLDDSMIANCGNDCPDRDDFVFDFAQHAASVFSDRTSGLIESTEDSTIAGFFGAGQYDCATVPFVTPLPAEKFRQGVLAFRESMRMWPSFGTYLPDGKQHTWIDGDSFYTGVIGNTRLVDWFDDIVEGRSAAHVGP